MANSLANLNARIHRASCAELNALLTEVQDAVAAYPVLEHYALNHWLREMNKRSLNNCGVVLFSPYDAGLRPLSFPTP